MSRKTISLLLLLTLTLGAKSNIFESQILPNQANDFIHSKSLKSTPTLDLNTSKLNSSIQIDLNNDGNLDQVNSEIIDSNLNISILIGSAVGVLEPIYNPFLNLNFKDQLEINESKIYFVDLDGDQFLDMWVRMNSSISSCDQNRTTHQIYKNLGNGEFEFANSYYNDVRDDTSWDPQFIYFKDINNDGLLEPGFINNYVINYDASSWNFLNEGNFNFKLGLDSMLVFISDLKAKDFNNDGVTDFITTSELPNKCSLLSNSKNLSEMVHGVIWLGNEEGGFTTTESEMLRQPSLFVDSIDLNSDGVDEIVISDSAEYGNDNTNLHFVDPQLNSIRKINIEQSFVDIKFADLDRDGDLDIVGITSSNITDIEIYQNLNNSEFILMKSIPFTSNINASNYFYINDYGDVLLTDLNNNGLVDILVNSKFNDPENPSLNKVKYYENNGLFEFNNEIEISPIANGIGNYDINSDGRMDIITFSELYNENVVYINQGDNQFTRTIYELPFFSNQDPSGNIDRLQNVVIEDINNDNKDDIIGIQRFVAFQNPNYLINTYIKDSVSRNNFYKNLSFNTSQYDLFNHTKTKTVFDLEDFNNDGFVDVISTFNNQISINTQVENREVSDVYYDPSHSGHGFSIESMGRDNLFYTVFYSFDEQGESEWFIKLNHMMTRFPDYFYTGEDSNISSIYSFDSLGSDKLINFNYDFNSSSTIANIQDEKLGRIKNSLCDKNDQSISIDFTIGLRDTETGSWCSQKLISSDKKPKNDFSGLWWAGSGDSGWGLSLNFVQRSDQVDAVALLFFYDGDGKSRWLVGQAGNFIPGQPLNFEMSMMRGYGREQNQVELSSLPAGNIKVTLFEKSQDLTQAGKLDMNVYYPMGKKVHWVRQNTPFALFSEPRK